MNALTGKFIQVEVRKITVSAAEKLLEKNHNNRKPRKSHIQHLARQMSKGRWKLSPQPIVVTKSGYLVDGQHRMIAVVESGATIEVLVAIIPDESQQEIFTVLDQGAARSVADILHEDRRIILPINFLLRAGIGINKASPEDVQILLNSEMGSLLRILHNEIKPSSKTWKHTAFRAAFCIAVLSGSVSKEKAISAYKSLNEDALTDWPKVFAALYRQLNELDRPIITSGRSLDNDFFIRGLFAFLHFNKPTKSIRITPSFKEDAKNMVQSVLEDLGAARA